MTDRTAFYLGGALARIGEGPGGPAPGVPDVYGPLIGAWSVSSTWYQNGEATRTGSGEWRFSRILGGRGVIDALYALGSEPDGYGVTLRTYDAASGGWRAVWSQPGSGEYAVLTGREEGGRVVHEGEGREPGSRIRWSFAELGAESFLWTGERRAAGGNWVLEQEIRGRRMANGGRA